jgi:hypothetical protein
VSSFLLRLGAEELVAASASSLQGEAGLWAIRAEELNAARVFPMSAKGTTAVIRVRNIITGEDMTWIATESKAMPKEWEGLLQPGEVFVEVSGHAEESNIKALGEEWKATAWFWVAPNSLGRPISRLTVSSGGPSERAN